MGTILYGAFALGHGAVEKSQAGFEKNQKLRSVDEILGSYIRSSYPYRVSPQDAAVYFLGEETEMSFISSFSLTMGGRGMAKVHVSWQAGEKDSGELRLEEEVPVRIDSDEDPGGYRNGIVVREGIKEFRLAYLDPQSEEEKWEDRWDAKERRTLPRAVRLNYRTEEGREVRWVFPMMMSLLAQQP
jgi:hypothetical protein